MKKPIKNGVWSTCPWIWGYMTHCGEGPQQSQSWSKASLCRAWRTLKIIMLSPHDPESCGTLAH